MNVRTNVFVCMIQSETCLILFDIFTHFYLLFVYVLPYVCYVMYQVWRCVYANALENVEDSNESLHVISLFKSKIVE